MSNATALDKKSPLRLFTFDAVTTDTTQPFAPPASPAEHTFDVAVPADALSGSRLRLIAVATDARSESKG